MWLTRRRAEYGDEPEYQFGSLEDCDFSEADLNYCRFIGCDTRTLRLRAASETSS